MQEALRFYPPRRRRARLCSVDLGWAPIWRNELLRSLEARGMKRGRRPSLNTFTVDKGRVSWKERA